MPPGCPRTCRRGPGNLRRGGRSRDNGSIVNTTAWTGLDRHNTDQRVKSIFKVCFGGKRQTRLKQEKNKTIHICFSDPRKSTKLKLSIWVYRIASLDPNTSIFCHNKVAVAGSQRTFHYPSPLLESWRHAHGRALSARNPEEAPFEQDIHFGITREGAFERLARQTYISAYFEYPLETPRYFRVYFRVYFWDTFGILWGYFMDRHIFWDTFWILWGYFLDTLWIIGVYLLDKR